MSEMKIKFYKLVEKYGAFSNFSRHKFILDGKEWMTSEHYFQSQKYLDDNLQERVRLAESPKIAANIGRDRSLPLRSDWESIKDSIMKKALIAKFSQHQDIKDLLLSTDKLEIIEDSPIDYYWGCGKDGTGKNMLGKLLMEVREEFKNVDIMESL